MGWWSWWEPVMLGKLYVSKSRFFHLRNERIILQEEVVRIRGGTEWKGLGMQLSAGQMLTVIKRMAWTPGLLEVKSPAVPGSYFASDQAPACSWLAGGRPEGAGAQLQGEEGAA